ncbi:protein RFT1 homolog [Neocloeon triangulifer]|uniref:protein RFT1 homolog n=1 Tax=Neocloeon triangulifer TaxID=2078957 RepID=UPI00286EBDEB|nr:protein RFT1 homolog [Neocloeon triangulifer]
MEQSLLTSSLQNISFGIVLQIIVRVITFLSNACVLRYISPDALGLMNVRLLLLESTILFVSREAFRKSTLDDVRNHNWPLVINLIWITLPISVLISVVLGHVWLDMLEAPPPHLQSQYVTGVWVMALSCIIESTCEAPLLVANAFLFNKLKVALNLLHIGLRTLVFLPLVLCSPSNSVHAFSAAQAVGTLTLVLGYYGYFYHYLRTPHKGFPFKSIRDFLPRFDLQQWIHRPLAWLTWSLFKTMAVKQLLTEGERYVMTISGVLSLTQQGVYETVNNLGTLPARLLFRPIEESCYFYFAQLFRRGEQVSKLNKDHMEEASKLLFYAMRCTVVFGLTVMAFGFSYSRLLLFLYGGESLATDTGTVLLRAHCTVILFLAINGITEAFGQSAMSKEQLSWYNYSMVLLSVAFLVISWALTYLLGGLGFILANCCNMATRICCSLKFMYELYDGSKWQPLKGLLPGPLIVTALAVSFLITNFSESLYFDENKLVHLMIGACCGLFSVAVFFYEEKELFKIICAKLGIDKRFAHEKDD